jgi:hypothetical protein
MDILIYVIISGVAVAFATEFVSAIVGYPRVLKIILTSPLAFGACYLFGITFPQIWVCALAASFVSTSLLQILNRPVTIQTTRR